MTSFAERLDRFVRWFFDSSPTTLQSDRSFRSFRRSMAPIRPRPSPYGSHRSGRDFDDKGNT